MSAQPPIFIFGVPRSGTTLLRTILNGHPHIACGPEAPWLAHQNASVMAFSRLLTEGEFSFSRNFGVPPGQVRARVREFVDNLFSDFARQQGKQRWAHKTPDDCLFVDFFAELFPDAKYIHIVRHPLDVALSTARIAAHRKGVSDWHEKNLVLEEGTAIPNTLFNAVLRWRRWNGKIRRGLASRDHVQVRYEDLVSQAVPTFQSLFQYLQEPFDPGILDYGQFPNLFPGWEWGSADVKRAGAINIGSLERWKRELTAEEAQALLSVAGPSERSISAQPVSASTDPMKQSPATSRIFLDGLNDLATSLALPPCPERAAGSAPAWWWFSGLSAVNWAETRLVAIGTALSPLPWFLSLLGANVTLVDSEAALAPRWEEWQRRLKVDVNVQIVPDVASSLPIETGSADVVLVDASASRNPAGMDCDLTEIARLLRSEGLLALSLGSQHGAGTDALERREQLRRQRTFRLLSHSGEKLGSAAPNDSDPIADAALLIKIS